MPDDTNETAEAVATVPDDVTTNDTTLPIVPAEPKGEDDTVEPKAEPERLIKQTTVEKLTLEPGSRTMVATISAPTLDSDHEVIMPKGGDFSRFDKHPVVLYGHDYRGLPVGKSVWVRATNAVVKAKTEFLPDGVSDLADAVFRYAQTGFPLAMSIGFDVLEAHEPDDKELKKWPGVRRIIDRWKLWEYSLVSMPANEDALVEAVAKGQIDAQTLQALNLEVPALVRPMTASFVESKRIVTVAVSCQKKTPLSPEELCGILDQKFPIVVSTVRLSVWRRLGMTI